MNIKLFQFSTAIIFLLSACATPLGTSTPVTVINSTATPSLIPMNTNTLLPTETLTPSITPLPTIPTFTPTFDASIIVTGTQAAKAECPKENSEIMPAFPRCYPTGGCDMIGSNEVLSYLNLGGTLAQLEKIQLGASWEKVTDLNGDGLNEVVFRGLASYSILGCKDGHYQDLFDFTGEFGADLADVLDLNKDGIPELILYDFNHYGYANIFIFEWDGNKFRS